MRAINASLAATFLLASTTPAAVHAQQDQIPKELALALIPFGASEGGEIIVGKLPPDLAASVTLPPGGRVLGSFVSLGYGQAVLTVPFGADSARAFVRGQLLDHGWAAAGATAFRMGGLQFGPRGSLPTIFCKPGTSGTLNLSTQYYGRETLVRLTRNSDMSACEGEVRGTSRDNNVSLAEREAAMPFSTVPPLWSPGDPLSSMRVCRTPSSSGALSFQSQEQWLRSELSAQAILDYYGKQLDSAGWKPATTTMQHLAKTWTKVTPSGDSAQDLTLSVTKIATPACYQIDLQATPRGPKR